MLRVHAECVCIINGHKISRRSYTHMEALNEQTVRPAAFEFQIKCRLGNIPQRTSLLSVYTCQLSLKTLCQLTPKKTTDPKTSDNFHEN